MFEKYSNTKFHENLSSGTRVVSCEQTDGRKGGETDRYVEADSRFS